MSISYRVASQPLTLLRKPRRNRAYRQFLKGQHCTSCGQNWFIDPAHTGPHALSSKASDLDAIPLCRKCHDEYHLGHADFLIRHRLDLRKAIANLQKKAVEQGIDLSADETPRKRLGRAGGFRRRGVA
jgi:hypothetical protein